KILFSEAHIAAGGHVRWKAWILFWEGWIHPGKQMNCGSGCAILCLLRQRARTSNCFVAA
ncbi:MAG: hypothetical protein Q7U55_07220, partial [Deltaproteobacteria bacterium]|nr:hypothetical protein [Deltaproteobacteria bacterium]